jgi:hypothetical protein
MERKFDDGEMATKEWQSESDGRKADTASCWLMSARTRPTRSKVLTESVSYNVILLEKSGRFAAQNEIEDLI